MSAIPVPECLDCGACCFGQGARYVPVSGDDHARLGAWAEELTQFVGNRCYMRMVDDHCAALYSSADGRFLCGVYEARPQTCRDLERGGGACRAELEHKQALPQRARLPILTTARVPGAALSHSRPA